MSIPNLRYHCHKILPLVYDNSLSYYELLCKVTSRLNAIIDLLNEDGYEAIIKEEVDNWLAEHPEATTTVNYNLTDRVYETVSDMIADENAENGWKVRTCGYYAYGDGGGYFYKIKTAAEQNAINIPLDSGLYAVMQDVGYYTPQMFGCYYDNETNLSENTNALQNAVNYASAHDVPCVINGNIFINDNITLHDNIWIVSDGFTITQTAGYQTGSAHLYGYGIFEAIGISNVHIEGVHFVNTGISCYDSISTPLSWDGWGVGIGLARCENIQIINCHFFKCGGKGWYSSSIDKWDYFGFAIWLSVCKNAIITGNIIECCHNGICVDRWFKDDANVWYNHSITISGNIIKCISGDAIGYEGSGDSYNIVIANNSAVNVRRSLVAGAKFYGVVVEGNTLDNNPALRGNPVSEYGQSGDAWNWDMSQDLYPAITVRGGYSRDCVISDNVINHATYGVSMPAEYNIKIVNNSFDNIVSENVHLVGGYDADVAALGKFIISGNTFKTGDVGIGISNVAGYEQGVALNDVIITGNISDTDTFVTIVRANDIAISDNVNNAPSRFSYCTGLKIDDVVNGYDAFSICTGIYLKTISWGAEYGVQFTNCSEIHGVLYTEATNYAIYASTDASGELVVVYNGSEPSNNWMNNVFNSLTLDIQSHALPTKRGVAAGSRWKIFEPDTALTSGSVVDAVYNGSDWVPIVTL